ncbi:MAG: VCBS repeat-containing protein [Deltaproteobacteria bacterium]|nr:VCBS repeat-containing protein [Deltaproteobacteria bacterium]
MNGDGRQDLVAFLGPGLCVMLGNGDATFASPVCSPARREQLDSEISFADLDGDGWLEVIIGGDLVTVLLGNGDGRFGTQLLYEAGGRLTLDVADFDGDGRLDLLVDEGRNAAVLPGRCY